MTLFLVTGASGLLGVNFALAVKKNDHHVIGVGNTALKPQAGFEYLQADLTQPGVIDPLLAQTRPDVVVHCAALANLEACEANPELAAEVNAVLPGRLAEAALQCKAGFIHISTDAVFDGSMGHYRETEQPNPLSVYARTKWEGEQAVAAANPQALIARVNFYGWSAAGNRSLAEFFVNNLSRGQRVKGFTDVFFCPLMVVDLVDLLVEAAQKHLAGLYHVVGAQPMTKYDFGAAIARRFGFDPALITPALVAEGGLSAARSPNLTLDTGKITAALGHPLPDFDSGLDKFYEQYRQGYPQSIRAMAQPA